MIDLVIVGLFLIGSFGIFVGILGFLALGEAREIKTSILVLQGRISNLENWMKLEVRSQGNREKIEVYSRKRENGE